MSVLSHPLIFLRHYPTLWNQEGRFQGATDLPLSTDGAKMAKSAQNHFVRLFHDGYLQPEGAHIVCSPMIRAVMTSQILAQTPHPQLSGQYLFDRNIVTDPRLREVSFGRWEGLTSLQVKQQFYHERRSRKSSYWSFAPQGGESMAERCGEVSKALESAGHNTVFVTHSAIMRIIHHILTGIPAEDSARLHIAHDEIWIWNGHTLRQL